MVALELPKFFIDLQIPLLYINNLVALAIGPRNHFLRIALTLPLLVLLLTQSLYRQWTGEWGIHYAINCLMLSTVFVYVDWILLDGPDKERWHKIRYDVKEKGRDEEKKKEGEVPEGFLNRLWWGVRLATGNRYVGWSNQVKNVPVEVDADYSRLYVHIPFPLLVLSNPTAKDDSLSANLCALLSSTCSWTCFTRTPHPHRTVLGAISRTSNSQSVTRIDRS